MKLSYIFESDLFLNDKDFEHEEEKFEYYSGEFWIDCDYAVVNGVVYDFVVVNDEIIYKDDYIPDEVLKMIERFMSDEYKIYFDELHVGIDTRVEDDELYNPDLPYIKYRGGQGYWYAHHQYKYPLNC